MSADLNLHQNGWDKPWDALPTAPIDRNRTSPDGNLRITLADGSEFDTPSHKHDFKPWRYGPLGRQRTCATCEFVEHA